MHIAHHLPKRAIPSPSIYFGYIFWLIYVEFVQTAFATQGLLENMVWSPPHKRFSKKRTEFTDFSQHRAACNVIPSKYNFLLIQTWPFRKRWVYVRCNGVHSIRYVPFQGSESSRIFRPCPSIVVIVYFYCVGGVWPGLEANWHLFLIWIYLFSLCGSE